ncbi:MAG: iron ABC transporter permease [Muribaculaceae bacterium]|nr:iron ABC transporter permease [Muribaculaceae bacterium]
MKGSRSNIIILTGAAVILLLFTACLLSGAVDIPAGQVLKVLCGGDAQRRSWQVIVSDTRIPAAVTALLAGSALAVAGLLLQTVFNNPLAGPSIMGISTGASLGVAVVMLGLGSAIGTMSRLAVLGGAAAGAAAVMLILLMFSSVIRSGTMLLIIGILVGYLSSSAISLLNFFSTQEGVHSYVIWGLGNFTGVTRGMLPLFSLACLIPLGASFFMVKPLDALLLGERYAASCGVQVQRVRTLLLLLSGLLTASVTAWCGPIAFIGLIVPHVARLLTGVSTHGRLMTATAVCGAATGLLCQWVSVACSSRGILPVNAITPIIGVPVIIYVILQRKRIFYFN